MACFPRTRDSSFFPLFGSDGLDFRMAERDRSDDDSPGVEIANKRVMSRSCLPAGSASAPFYYALEKSFRNRDEAYQCY